MAESLSRIRLQELRDTAAAEHERAIDALAVAVQHACRAGEALIEAKELIGHGGWMAWVKVNFDFSHATATNYMKLARNYERVSNLPSIRAALAELARDNGPPPGPDTILNATLAEAGAGYEPPPPPLEKFESGRVVGQSEAVVAVLEWLRDQGSQADAEQLRDLLQRRLAELDALEHVPTGGIIPDWALPEGWRLRSDGASQ